MIDGLAAACPGNWVWKRQPIQPGNALPTMTAEVLAALVPILSALIPALSNLSLPPTHGGMGHNSYGVATPPTKLERDELIADITQAKAVAENAESGAISTIRTIWAKISPKLAAFGLWTLDRVNDFFTEASKEAGKKAGAAAVIVGGAFALDPHITLYSLFLEADHLIRLLGTL